MRTVAVIIPVYNMEKYLEECLDSVLAQTLENFEIICINDGSSDTSPDILKRYAEKNECITVIDQENQGVSAARNARLKSSDAEYVCFMDPDDFYPDDKVLEDLYEGGKSHKALICGGSFSIYNNKTKERTAHFDGFYKPYIFSKNAVISYENYQYDYGYHRFLYSLKLLKTHNIEFPPYRRFQDPPFFVKAMIAAKEFYAIKRVVYCYRVGHQNVKWDEEKVLALMRGICDNLHISEEHQLSDLHAITVQRIIEHKKAFEMNRIENASEEFKNVFWGMLLGIRMDLVKKSKYDISINQLLRVLNGILLHRSIYDIYNYHSALAGAATDKYDAVEQVNRISSSWPYRIGRFVTFVPRKIWGGYRCCREHGLRYTWNRLLFQLRIKE